MRELMKASEANAIAKKNKKEIAINSILGKISEKIEMRASVGEYECYFTFPLFTTEAKKDKIIRALGTMGYEVEYEYLGMCNYDPRRLHINWINETREVI